MLSDASNFIVGWQEWIALPELGLPALKAKIDTGAKTSALHTHRIEPYGSAKRPKVRFSVRPSKAGDLEIAASADVVDRREVISSNGVPEMRYVIMTPLSIAGRHSGRPVRAGSITASAASSVRLTVPTVKKWK